MLGHSFADLLDQAAGVLFHLARDSEPGCEVIVEAGALSTLVVLLGHQRWCLRQPRWAICCLMEWLHAFAAGALCIQHARGKCIIAKGALATLEAVKYSLSSPSTHMYMPACLGTGSHAKS